MIITNLTATVKVVSSQQHNKISRFLSSTIPFAASCTSNDLLHSRSDCELSPRNFWTFVILGITTDKLQKL